MNWRELVIEVLLHPVNLNDEVVGKDACYKQEDVPQEYLLGCHLDLDKGKMILQRG